MEGIDMKFVHLFILLIQESLEEREKENQKQSGRRLEMNEKRK